jgi:hypothetical protein
MRLSIRMYFGALAVILATGSSPAAIAQQPHAHTLAASGLPHGVPFFCANPTVTSASSGAWSDPATWSTRKVPGANDKVAIAAGNTVTYDVVSEATLACIEVRGALSFRTDANTRLHLVTMMVLDEGALAVGRPEAPVSGRVRAEIVIADRPFDETLDPSQAGHGIVAFGKVTMHGAVKTPTFIRFAQEPLAGATRVVFDKSVEGWQPGDALVIPDTRQLRANESGRSYESHNEKVAIASVSGSGVTLAAPLAHDHKGARNAAGRLEFLPHAGNITRNVVVRSENPAGTRGHVLFASRADVDIRYVEFRELGRTKLGILNNTQTDSEGRVSRIGTNQIGRYAVHFHHTFGPTRTPGNGYQFTLIGNAIDGSPKWGLVVHRSHYGLVRENVVYNTRGAGIVTEDGTESFNVFERNFSMRTTGSRDAAPGNGYSSVLPNPGGDGSAFWFRGPNNYIRDNVAASAAESGFGLPVMSLGVIRVPKSKGAESSRESESVPLDTARAPVLEFSNNEAYGALQSGVGWAWSGTISGLRVWHVSRHGVMANPSAKLVIDGLVVRNDPAILVGGGEDSVGVWVSNYLGREVTVTKADVEGTRIGVLSPFFYNQTTSENAEGLLTIENSAFRTHVGVTVATAYADDSPDGMPAKRAVVRGIRFTPLAGTAPAAPTAEAISMNYGMPPHDTRPRVPLAVYDFNQQAGRNFNVYYSLGAPEGVAPCRDTQPDIGGWVCAPK